MVEIPFLCCRSSLHRLATEDLQRQCSRAKMEEILLRHYSLETSTQCIKYPHSNLLVDSDAYSKLKSFSGKDNGRRTIQVTGDGSCLFNAVSVALYGNEAHSMELRTRTVIELILHAKEYEHTYPQFNDVCSMAETITDGCNGGYSSAFTIAALSTVIQHPIGSVYPPLNGLIDEVFRILTVTVHPFRSSTNTNEKLLVMWTKTGHVVPNSIWFPNHFVPLLIDNHDQPEMIIISDSSSLDPEFPVSPFGHSTPDSERTETAKEPGEIITSDTSFFDPEVPISPFRQSTPNSAYRETGNESDEDIIADLSFIVPDASPIYDPNTKN